MKFSYNLEALRCLRETPHELKGFGYIDLEWEAPYEEAPYLYLD